jgi:hypothetical protein
VRKAGAVQECSPVAVSSIAEELTVLHEQNMVGSRSQMGSATAIVGEIVRKDVVA